MKNPKIQKNRNKLLIGNIKLMRQDADFCSFVEIAVFEEKSRARSFFYDSEETSAPPRILKLSLPKFHFLFFKDVGGGFELLSCIQLDDNLYCTFPMLNSFDSGGICLNSKTFGDGESAISYFWNSTFTLPPAVAIRVNENLIIDSIAQWEKLTRQNPNFMKEQFDIYSFTRNAHCIYEICCDHMKIWHHSKFDPIYWIDDD